jgi:hypothetical protein
MPDMRNCFGRLATAQPVSMEVNMRSRSRGVLIALVAVLTVLTASDALAERLRCASRDYRYAFCPTPGRVVAARVVRRHSKRPCLQNYSWGFQRDGIWVDDGCDADFDVSLRGQVGPPDPRPPFGGPPASVAPAPWAIGEWRGAGYRLTVYRGGSVVLARGRNYERGYMDGDNVTLHDGTRLDADRERTGMQLTWPGGRRVFLRRERGFDY